MGVFGNSLPTHIRVCLPTCLSLLATAALMLPPEFSFLPLDMDWVFSGSGQLKTSAFVLGEAQRQAFQIPSPDE